MSSEAWSDADGRGDVASGQPVIRPAPEVAEAVRVACQRLFAIESVFLDSYYAALVHLVPIIRRIGQDEGRAVADGLARSVLWAALTDDPPEVVEATFQSVGAEYYRQGFPEEGYHGAGHALLRSARDVYTTDWSSQLSSGWVAFFGWLGPHLQEGARQAEEAGVPRLVPLAGEEPSGPPRAGNPARGSGPAHAAGPPDAFPGDRPLPGSATDPERLGPVPAPRPDTPQRGWRRVVPSRFR